MKNFNAAMARHSPGYVPIAPTVPEPPASFELEISAVELALGIVPEPPKEAPDGDD